MNSGAVGFSPIKTSNVSYCDRNRSNGVDLGHIARVRFSSVVPGSSSFISFAFVFRSNLAGILLLL